MQSSSTETIEIVLNGVPRRVPADLSVLQLLASLGIEPERVAVELNETIVRRPKWDSIRVSNGARLEVVQFVGGG
jgi:thiamine biosynthesis protein ThiS